MAGFRWTIRRKLLALGIATFLPLLLLLAYWARWEYREHMNAAEAELTLASEQVANQVEELLQQMERHLRTLARRPAVQRLQVGLMEELFREVVRDHPELENVFALTAEGRLLASAVPAPPGGTLTAGDRQWFRQAVAGGGAVVGEFQIGRLTGQPVAIIALPLRGERGVTIGVLAAGLSLRRLHTLFGSLPLAPGMTVAVVDGGERVLSHNPAGGERWLGRRLPSALPAPSDRAIVTSVAWFEGGERIAAIATVAGSGWRALVAVPRASIEDRVSSDVALVGLPLLALLAAAGLAGLVIARRVWQPLERLTEAAARLPRGEPSPVTVESTDEVGDLARAFNAMVAQVTETRASLERRVAEQRALVEAGRLLVTTLDLDEVLRRLAELVRDRLGVDVVRIWLQETSSEEFGLYGDTGVTRREDYRVRLGPGEGLVGWIMARREPLVLPDLQDDPRLKNRAWVKAEGLHSFLGVPILLQDEPVGVLACTSRERREFSHQDIALARVFALPAAVAIRNARLYDQARQALGDLKAAQQRLVEGETLRAVGNLAAGMAHHLNNILAVIRGRVQLLLRSASEPSLRRSLESVERAAVKGAEVIRQVQEFIHGQPVPGTIAVDLNRLVGEALDAVRSQWAAGIEAVTELAPVPAVTGEPAALREALASVLLNAVDALPQGGRITVRTWASEQRVFCSVTDTGAGMSDEVRRQALQPFFTTKGPKRRGLGLSLAHGVLRSHGGTIGIESAPERGTTVTIALPAAPAPLAEPLDPAAIGAAAAGTTGATRA